VAEVLSWSLSAGEESFRLDEQDIGVLDDLGDLARMGRAWGDAQEMAPCPLSVSPQHFGQPALR
jgi:hypothetical protein